MYSAEALQTLLQLLGEKDLYDYHRDTYKVHGIDWTVDKASRVLDAWRRKFTQVRLPRSLYWSCRRGGQFAIAMGHRSEGSH